MRKLTDSKAWKLFSVLPRADVRLAVGWWIVVLLRGILPAAFALATGALVGAVQQGANLAAPLVIVGVVFVLLQILTPINTALSLRQDISGWSAAMVNFTLSISISGCPSILKPFP